MYETPVLLSTQPAGLMELIPYGILAKDHACMMAKRIIDVYTGLPFYISMEIFCMADVRLPKHQKLVRLELVANR